MAVKWPQKLPMYKNNKDLFSRSRSIFTFLKLKNYRDLPRRQ